MAGREDGRGRERGVLSLELSLEEGGPGAWRGRIREASRGNKNVTSTFLEFQKQQNIVQLDALTRAIFKESARCPCVCIFVCPISETAHPDGLETSGRRLYR